MVSDFAGKMSKAQVFRQGPSKVLDTLSASGFLPILLFHIWWFKFVLPISLLASESGLVENATVDIYSISNCLTHPNCTSVPVQGLQ